MNEFLTASFSYPTIVFTVLLSFAIFFWLLSFVGVVGLDSLDFDVDAELDVDADLDGHASDAMAAAGYFQRAPIRVIPLSIALSMFFLFGWFTSQITVLTFAAELSRWLPSFVWGTLVLLGAAFVSLLVTNLIAMPLAPVFHTHAAPKKRHLIGKVVEIKTGRVDRTFGTGFSENGGAGLLVEVRAEPGQLRRGDHALVISYDARTDSYEVSPLEEELLPGRE